VNEVDAERCRSRDLSLQSFSLTSSRLAMGASLGNSALFLHTKGDGTIERIFLNSIGRALVGSVNVRYAGSPEDSGSFFPTLFAEGERTLEIHPAYQRVRFQVGGVIDITETTFVPFAQGDPGEDLPVAYVAVDVANHDSARYRMRVTASAMLRGGSPADVSSHYDNNVHALIARNVGNAGWIRVFGSSEAPTRFGADRDFGRSNDPVREDELDGETSESGDLIGRLQWDLPLAPSQCRRLWFAIGLYAEGEHEALQRYAAIPDADRALDATVAALQNILSSARVLTPDPVINQGALWSKINMRRVMAAYPTGQAFTNDPGTYANVVIRDAAWFTYGNDHFLPAFSRRLLDNCAQRQYPSGKMPEYFDAISGKVEDDGLNINDDTPLYILAVNHHFRSTGDWDWLTKTYPAVSRAAEYIISQVDDRGLVFCTATDPRGDVWAIAGWRNIIGGHQISGAVTEVNAECVAALRAASHLAGELRHPDQSERFGDASRRIQAAMDTYLINPKNGLYYLNIDVDGHARTDVTGDEIFPVIMRACSEEAAFAIVSRLNAPDFWTSAGLRTVSRRDPGFDQSASSGLMGGVWPGLTWWYAFGAARYHPEFMVRALRSSFEHYGADPKRYNTVPGQFSEWFDGESLANRGMRLSPWEPPRFLWAAVEGVCGLMLMPGSPRVNPVMPKDWNWVALRDVPYHGERFSYFLVREPDGGARVHSTCRIDCDWPTEIYTVDISDDVRIYAQGAVVVAFKAGGRIVVLLGNTSEQTVYAPVYFTDERLLPERAGVRVYNSERRAWEERGVFEQSALRSMAFPIECSGFRLLELSA
jgi:hypothetical protein